MNVLNIDKRITGHFEKLLASKRLGHAYLFVGPKEVGKTQTALRVAQLVNCESLTIKPCGECPSCLKVSVGNHPDVMIMQEVDGSIKIDQIRFLVGRLQLKAFEAKTKVFIIRNVENMTLDAANSLLKTLEEPASNTLMILTTAVLEANLDTIRSRCHVVKFFPVSRNRLQDVLGPSQPMTQFLAVYTDGCVGQARQLLENDFISYKNKVLDGFLSKSHEDIVGKNILEKDKSKEALHIFLSIIRDAILFKTGVASDELMHIDRLKDVHSLSRCSFDQLSAIYQQVVDTKELLDENLNAKMAFSILRQRVWAN
ncbi:MAG: DNA polymerase III subunit delta' C-terminal domain-containing protein [Candidatus Omnitrophota bacterium]